MELLAHEAKVETYTHSGLARAGTGHVFGAEVAVARWHRDRRERRRAPAGRGLHGRRGNGASASVGRYVHKQAAIALKKKIVDLDTVARSTLSTFEPQITSDNRQQANQHAPEI